MQNNRKTILSRFSTVLPNKHSRGGQSANRFARLVQQARLNYVVKVADAARALFIGEEGKVEVEALILAGSADIKTVLGQSGIFDKRLQAIF